MGRGTESGLMEGVEEEMNMVQEGDEDRKREGYGIVSLPEGGGVFVAGF